MNALLGLANVLWRQESRINQLMEQILLYIDVMIWTSIRERARFYCNSAMQMNDMGAEALQLFSHQSSDTEFQFEERTTRMW